MKTKITHLLFGRIILFLAIIFMLNQEAIYAQCTPNIGFEQNNFAGWQCFTGTCCPISASVLGQVAGRHDITNSTMANDYYNMLPVVCPYLGYGAHSLKLGNDQTGAEAERVRTNFVVTSANASLIYRYAAVMENPSHTITDQPRLEFSVYDNGPANNMYATPVLVQCPSLIFQTPSSSTSLPPGWYVSPNLSTSGAAPVYCSNWIPVSVNMGSLVGHSVTVEFATGDCALGGHFGYAYIDLNCGAFSIVNGYCPGSTQAVLYGPPGFANYIWDTAGTGLPYIQQGPIDSIVLISPDSNVIYSVVLVPPNGAGCQDTLYDTIHVQPRPSAYFHYNAIACAGGLVTFYDSSVTHILGSNIVSWNWDFGDPNSGVVNNHSTNQNPQHAFSAPGTYNVSLIVTSDISCVSDTTVQSITVVPPPPVNPDAGPNVTLCKYDTTNLQATANAAFGPYTYSWSPANLLSNDSIPNPVAHNLVTTTFIVTVTDPTGCALFDSVKVIIAGAHPVFNITGDDTICPGASDQLGINNTSPDPIPASATYLWAPVTALSSALIANPIATPVNTITYAVTINDNGCSASRFFTINIDNRNTLAAPSDTTYCLGNSAHLYAMTSGPAPSGGFAYNWTPATNLSNPSAQNTLANPTTTTTYTVTTTTYGGCVLSDNVVVNVGQPYQLELADSIQPCFNKPMAVVLNNLKPDVNHFFWSIDISSGEVNCADCPTAIVNVNQGVWLYVLTSNTLGCIVGDSIWVSPIDCPDIIVPSAFSPNGDGKNDFFFILDRHFLALNYFEIYNRWGEKVYSTVDLNAKGWDGTYRGQLQDIGAYIYKIQAVDRAGEVKNKTGNITLIR